MAELTYLYTQEDEQSDDKPRAYVELRKWGYGEYSSRADVVLESGYKVSYYDQLFESKCELMPPCDDWQAIRTAIARFDELKAGREAADERYTAAIKEQDAEETEIPI